MRRIHGGLLLPMIALSAVLWWSAHAQTSSIVISEVYFNPEGADTGKEIVELYNSSSQTVDISSWELDPGALPYFTFPPGTFLLPNGTLTVHLRANGTNTFADIYTGTSFGSSDMSNSKGSVVLYTGTSHTKDTVVDFIQYGDVGQTAESTAIEAEKWLINTAVSISAEGQSIQRICLTQELSCFEHKIPSTGNVDGRLNTVPINSNVLIPSNINTTIVLGLQNTNSIPEVLITENQNTLLGNTNTMNSTVSNGNSTISSNENIVIVQLNTNTILLNSNSVLSSSNQNSLISQGNTNANQVSNSNTSDLSSQNTNSVFFPQINLPPVPQITVQGKGVLTGYAPFPLNVTGEHSTDDRGISSYLWDFGDGYTFQGKNPLEHTYATPGTYSLNLTVIDTDGTSRSQILLVLVQEKTTSSDTSGQSTNMNGTQTNSVSTGTSVTVSLNQNTTDGAVSQIPTSCDAKNQKYIMLSELLPNPTGKDKGKEWIELYNTSDTATCLTGMKIIEGKEKTQTFILTGIIIAAKSYLVLPDSVTKIAMDNRKGMIRLFTSISEELEKVEYEKAPSGKSWSKTK